jgi:hypothetical protein
MDKLIVSDHGEAQIMIDDATILKLLDIVRELWLISAILRMPRLVMALQVSFC